LLESLPGAKLDRVPRGGAVAARFKVALFVTCLAALLVAAPAHAAFPGANGKIAFVSTADGDSEIYTIRPDGTDLQQLTHNSVPDLEPAWSPDGQRIAFVRGGDVYAINGDGSGEDLVVHYPVTPIGPSWSPDGQQIAFSEDGHCDGIAVPGSGGVFTVGADGTGLAFLTCGADDGQCCGTAWSPDGSRIVWSEGSAWEPDIYLHTFGGGNANLTDTQLDEAELYPDWSPSEHKIAYTLNDVSDVKPDGVYTMNPDGSAKAFLASGSDPVWSPDGSKIAVDGISVMNPDGSGATFLTSGTSPTWQPIPINSYARPKGATPTRIALVTANRQCTTPNRAHGAPLAFGSCTPPQLTSNRLTVGTGDSNARPALMQASIRLDVASGDVRVRALLNDIFNKNLSDYTGGLRASLPVQITDKDNTPAPGGPGAATTQTFPLEFDIGCSPTADTSSGSDCALDTTLDTLVPGTVIAAKRAIWQLGQAKVFDGGADGNPATTGDNALFAVQGVFVP
jgi:Tol biopolymer transport system component